MVSPEESKRRAAYGRGLRDGLKMLGVSNLGEAMNAAKFERKVQELTTTARKVFDVIPANDAWGREKIISECFRVGHHIQKNIVDGCIAALKEDGLVKEPRPGQFTRAKHSDYQPPAEPPQQESVTAKSPVQSQHESRSEKQDLLSRIANLSSQLRATANDLDSVALEVAETIQSAAKDSEKFRQLQALLKDAGA